MFSIDREMIIHYMKVLHLQGIEWISPTQIGIYFGKRYDCASSWACKHLKVHLLYGRVRKNSKGHYCINIKGMENQDIIAWLKEVVDHDGFNSNMDKRKAIEVLESGEKL